MDTPLLAPGVGRLVCMELDDFPISFRKELLGHEAHRHPFIERLGLLYMLKLRLGARFGSRAGAGWRILFVVVLMPWMRRYRRSTTRSREEKEGQSSLFRSSSFSFQNISHAAVVMRKQELERENVTLRRENERLQKMLLSRELKNGLWSTRFYGKQKGEIDGGRSARFRERHDGGIIIVEA